MIYFALFLGGMWLGKMFYFDIYFILYFYSILLAIYLFYFYALYKKRDEKEKTFYIPIEKTDEQNEKKEKEIPIIRY